MLNRVAVWWVKMSLKISTFSSNCAISLRLKRYSALLWFMQIVLPIKVNTWKFSKSYHRIIIFRTNQNKIQPKKTYNFWLKEHITDSFICNKISPVAAYLRKSNKKRKKRESCKRMRLCCSACPDLLLLTNLLICCCLFAFVSYWNVENGQNKKQRTKLCSSSSTKETRALFCVLWGGACLTRHMVTTQPIASSKTFTVCGNLMRYTVTIIIMK